MMVPVGAVREPPLPTTLHLPLFQSSVLQQRFRVRFFTTEIFIHIHCVIDAARGKNVFTEFGSYFLIEDISGFLISLVSICIQDFYQM